MRRFAVAALLAAATLAGCDTTLTATRAPAGPRLDETNQPPVAVITYTRHLYSWGFRYYLNGSGSYDPDGTIDSRFWANDCPPKPESNAVNTTIDIYFGETCRVSLELWDNLGAFGMQEITLSN